MVKRNLGIPAIFRELLPPDHIVAKDTILRGNRFCPSGFSPSQRFVLEEETSIDLID